MGRHITNIGSFWRQGGPRWADPYYREWAVVVGDRIRRLRQDRGWPLHELARRVRKPEGGHYSAGYFSRLERGWGSAPLYVYIVIAEELDVDPGVLLGPDEVQREIRPAEGVLLRFLERAEIDPETAIARLALASRRAEAGVDSDGVEVHHAAPERAQGEQVPARRQPPGAERDPPL